MTGLRVLQEDSRSGVIHFRDRGQQMSTCFRMENMARTPPEPKKNGGRVRPFLRISTM